MNVHGLFRSNDVENILQLCQDIYMLQSILQTQRSQNVLTLVLSID